MLQGIVPRLLGYIPVAWRRAIIGLPASPSRVSTFMHHLLNLIPAGEGQVFPCKGALNGYHMCVDWSRFRSFVYGTWEPNVLVAVTSTVKPGMSIADIGAHVGYYTLLLAKCVGSSGSVLSFEPAPANFTLLKKNVELNSLPNVQLFPEAVYSQAGEITISVPEDVHKSGDASMQYIGRSRLLRVKAVTLDSFCASFGFRPDFLKMDVEGAEYDVLKGAQKTILQFRPKMLIELHHFDGNLAAHPVPGLLNEWGYDIQWIDRWEMTSHVLATPRSATELSLV